MKIQWGYGSPAPAVNAHAQSRTALFLRFRRH